MTNLNARLNPHDRTDDEVHEEIRNAICRRSQIRSLDVSSFSVLVKDGTVTLVGHLSMDDNLQLIERLCWSVSGVIAVKNRLVLDGDLQLQVAQALAKDERTRPFVFPVGSSHGWVSIAGQVPNREFQLVAEEVAGAVPSVRGVIALPTIGGQPPPAQVQPVQPQIAAQVYDRNGEVGEVGLVTEIVIQPRNRLVTHVVVLGKEKLAARTQRGTEHLVPVEAMEWVSHTSIFLRRNGPLLSSFPTFHTAEYPVAPCTWQPPYPYLGSCVRWPFNETREVGVPAMADVSQAVV